MGSLFSKSSKTPKSKDPKWQGIGPNTPLPGGNSSSNNNNYQTGGSSYGNRYGIGASSQGQGRSPTLATLDSRNSNATKKKSNSQQEKSSKINLMRKMDPKGKAGAHRKVIITKNLIGLPSDFRHTGHIGAGEVRSGQIDPEKIKNQMMEVAACLKLDINAPIPMLKTMPVQPENRDHPSNNQPDPLGRYGVRPGAVAAH
ncbi:hypothetical protein EMPS_00519 [Entomortierella parvispora]|uniref:CRIB domain-containing protein n=1 Tax=Entomortierella parvispora TaxID=205924 RepID=A0A9P3H1T4_9FUNG|nr:hypothetical protein EMPS_00519 [Entomortierella parvispora]